MITVSDRSVIYMRTLLNLYRFVLHTSVISLLYLNSCSIYIVRHKSFILFDVHLITNQKVIYLTSNCRKSHNTHYYRNKRIFYLIAIVITISLGLASRKYSNLLLGFVAMNAGDMLWAMMVYFGFRFLLVSKSLLLAILLSFSFSIGIECSQLYQADWINQIRDTLLGGLILGKGFLSEDLFRYSAGIISATFIDRLAAMIAYRSKN
ncbi:MAG: DUF2809 domain-containing protein [Bacillota bacterium]